MFSSDTAKEMVETTTFERQVAAGERFEFGKNWSRFLAVLNDDHIFEAESSLRRMLTVDSLEGRTFLDVGSGSGLFSLSAMRLGATRVHSFDFDPESVACAQELRRRFFPRASSWTIERGDVLDPTYLNGLGHWDIVYSWGVLHHTGMMWKALSHLEPLVAANGVLYISIYNDQGYVSRWWSRVKRLYNRGPILRGLVSAVYFPYFTLTGLAVDTLKRTNPLRRYTEYKKSRGMSRFHDLRDWLGGYPFEVAKPESILDFFRSRGCELVRLKTVAGGLGCNEYVFRPRHDA